MLGDARAHVGKTALHSLVDEGELLVGHRANLREAVGDYREAVHIGVHVADNLLVHAHRVEHLRPCHERRDGRAQLVSRLLRQTHPHPVLLRLLHADEGKIGDAQEQQHHSKLDVGVIGQTPQHVAVLVVEHLAGAVVDFYLNAVGGVVQFGEFARQEVLVNLRVLINHHLGGVGRFG